MFSSPVSLTGYQNLGHYEIFRYDSDGDSLDLSPPAPHRRGRGVGREALATRPQPGETAGCSSHPESFTLRDTNEKRDAYEWNDGRSRLISSGIGQDDSAPADGQRRRQGRLLLHPRRPRPDGRKRQRVKIYDAREDGGFLFDPPRGLCKASDECHGAGHRIPPPPNINTGTGPEQARPPVTPAEAEEVQEAEGPASKGNA